MDCHDGQVQLKVNDDVEGTIQRSGQVSAQARQAVRCRQPQNLEASGLNLKGRETLREVS